ncbi:hypothetical protein SBA4_2460009 [Candidatus Sulfopaludibacter sp. SbA4]|nr:hypothetical protein SBA4_2460009 [Candidatus Sulfopaludibacter sp. SbA4]
MRSTLVAALVACADSPWKAKARRFLCGLSSDELQYIAGFLGGCILESAGTLAGTPDSRQCSEDRALKMILVQEYMRRAGVRGPFGIVS